MSRESVERGIVLHVLKQSGVSVTDPDEEERVQIVRGTTVEVQRLPEVVDRRMVLRLAYKFKVPRHYFWNPKMMPAPGHGSGGPAN